MKCHPVARNVLNNSWRNLEAMYVFLAFVILPPANIQIAIFLIIWWQYGKKVLMIYHHSINVSKVGLSARPLRSSFRQYFTSLKAQTKKKRKWKSKIARFVDECFQFYLVHVIKFKFCNIWFKVSLVRTFKFLWNEDSDTFDNVVITSTCLSCILCIYTVN